MAITKKQQQAQKKAVQEAARKLKARAKKLQGQPEFVRGARLAVPTDEATAATDFTEIKDVRRRLYLQELCRNPRFSVAAKLAGISLKTEYNWRNETDDPVWMNALMVALSIGVSRAESEGWRRGVEGVEAPVYHAGRLVGTKREYSDALLMFMLKGAQPAKYRERYELSGPNGGPMQMQVQDYSTLTDAELAERAEAVVTVLRGAKPEGLPPAPANVIDAQPVEQTTQQRELEELKRQYAETLKARNGNNNGSGNNGNG